MIKARGRSNLHTHSVHWLADCVALVERYKDDNFLSTMNAYIHDTIHAHIEGLSERRGLAPTPTPHPSWAQPPDSNNNWPEISHRAELVHVEASQFHSALRILMVVLESLSMASRVCIPSTFYFFLTSINPAKCTRGLSPHVTIDKTGNWNACTFFIIPILFSHKFRSSRSASCRLQMLTTHESILLRSVAMVTSSPSRLTSTQIILLRILRIMTPKSRVAPTACLHSSQTNIIERENEGADRLLVSLADAMNSRQEADWSSHSPN